MSKVKKISNSCYLIEKEGQMRVPAKLFLNEDLMNDVENSAIEQVRNVATLPGIEGYSIAMPDMHSGYGFPIGGVAAFNDKTGVVSPGGIGFDINCSIRLLTSNLKVSNFFDSEKVLKRLFEDIPSGVGSESLEKISEEDFLDLVHRGIDFAIDKGYATVEDREHIEDFGRLPVKDLKISKRAIKRGRAQIGTLGSGNHFVEVQYIDKIFDMELAKRWNLEEGSIVVMIHTGSRGYGHQIATDAVKTFLESKEKYNIDLVDDQLACVPINSPEGQEYLNQMNSACNFAYVNRQMITHKIREIFKELDVDLKILYDSPHNIAKFEEYEFLGVRKRVLVHRKGATRALSKGNKLLPKVFFDTGQPILLPGSMGSYSYVLVGVNSESVSLGSASHGAGRIMSRSEAMRTLNYDDIVQDLKNVGVKILSNSKNGIIQEGPRVYKDVTKVVSALEDNDIARPVVRLKPILVIKG